MNRARRHFQHDVRRNGIHPYGETIGPAANPDGLAVHELDGAGITENDHTDGQTIDHFMKNLQMLVHMANLLADLQRTAQMGSKPFQYCELVRCCG